MKVLHIITTIEKGGAENQLKVLVREQVEDGFEVEVLYLKGPADLKAEFEQLGAVVNQSLSQRNFVTQYWLLKKKLQDFDGIIHAHLPRSELLSSLANSHERLVVSKHNTEQFFPGAPKLISNLLSRLVESRTAAVIAISEAVRDFLLERQEIVDTSKVHIIPYGFDVDFIDVNFESSQNDNRSFVIGTVARLTEQKSIPTLIKAFQLFKEMIPNAKLHIVGSGHLLQDLKGLTEELEISDSVIWFGRTDKVAHHMREMNLFVLPSLYEGFGLVLLEAIQLGIPVIASRNTAIIEVLGEESEGLFTTENVFELHMKLLRFTNPSERENLVAMQNKRLRKFDPKDMSDKILNVYSIVLAKK